MHARMSARSAARSSPFKTKTSALANVDTRLVISTLLGNTAVARSSAQISI